MCSVTYLSFEGDNSMQQYDEYGSIARLPLFGPISWFQFNLTFLLLSTVADLYFTPSFSCLSLQHQAQLTSGYTVLF